MVVNRLIRMLCLALFLGAQSVAVVLPAASSCEEKQDCCAPNAVCDVDCVQCACCAVRVSDVAVSLTVKPLDSPPLPATMAARSAPLPPPPGDILHVPKAR